MTSTVLISVQTLRPAISAAIQRILDDRQARREEMITYAMRQRKFLGINLKPRTREEAIKYLQKDMDSDYTWISVYYERQMERLQALRAACDVSSTGHVSVDTNDAKHLEKFFRL